MLYFLIGVIIIFILFGYFNSQSRDQKSREIQLREIEKEILEKLNFLYAEFKKLNQKIDILDQNNHEEIAHKETKEIENFTVPLQTSTSPLDTVQIHENEKEIQKAPIDLSDIEVEISSLPLPEIIPEPYIAKEQTIEKPLKSILNAINIEAENAVLSALVTETIIETHSSTETNEKTDVVIPASVPITMKEKVQPLQPNVTQKKDGPLSSHWKNLMSWFLQGNPIAKIGIILLFFGIGYFMKFSIEHNLVPVPVRFLSTTALCLCIFGCGCYFLKKNRLYGLILQGGGIGGLYITVFASISLYQLLPVMLGFALMIIFCVVCIVFACKQSSKSLAILATLGGYLAPLLLSTGSNDHNILFFYYTLISSAVLIISQRYPWRELNFIGFLFTFGVGFFWVLSEYQPTYYISAQIFLIFSLVLFGILAVITASRYQFKLQGVVDGTLVFGTAIIGSLMQYQITEHWTYGPAISATIMGIGYLLIAQYVHIKMALEGKRLRFAYLIIAIVLLAIAPPLAFDADITSIIWALQAIALLWLGFEQENKRTISCSLILLLISTVSTIIAYDGDMNNRSFAAVFSILSACYLAYAYLWQKYLQQTPPALFKIRPIAAIVSQASLVVSIVFCFWLIIELSQRIVGVVYPYNIAYPAAMALTAFTAVGFIAYYLAKRLNWQELLQITTLFFGVITTVFILQFLSLNDHNPLEMGVWSLAWATAIIFAFFLLYHLEKNSTLSVKFIQPLHLIVFWITIALLTLQVRELTAVSRSTKIAAYLIFFNIVFSLVFYGSKIRFWPFSEKNYRLYWQVGLLPIALGIIFFLVNANDNNGEALSGYYFPILNFFELATIWSMWSLWKWLNVSRQQDQQFLGIRLTENNLIVAFSILGFWLFNSLLLKTSAHFLALPWNTGALWASRIIQTIFSITWTIFASFLMKTATKNNSRTLWITGVCILGVVVIKLFFVDSARTNGIERAVAFLGVAILVLIIGYISPLPPKKKTIEEKSEQ